MAQIIIPKYIPGTSTGTLSGIASQYKTDIPTLQRLNPSIVDINKIQAGATLNIPDLEKPTTSPIGQNRAIVSSDLARNQYKQDIEKLGNLEAGFQTPTPTPTTTEKPQEGAVLSQETPLAITFKSTNPAYQSVIDQTNEAVKQFLSQGGILPPEINQRFNEINNFQFQKTQAIANARQATEEKDATKLGESLTKAKEAETAQKTEIDTLRKDLETARAGVLTALTPTEKEIELRKKLITLKTKRQLLPLELMQEGISAAGIAGRQVEDERVRAIQESNLLANIGLEQEARKMKLETYEKQAEWIKSDIELQNKIQEKLTEQENKVVEQARNLRKDSLGALKTIVETYGDNGLDWQDMDAQTQADVLNMISPYKDLTAGMISSALKVAKLQKNFKNSLEMKKKDTEINAETYDKAKLEAAQLFEIDKQRNQDKMVSPALYYQLRQKVPVSFRDDFDRAFQHLLSEESKARFGITPKKQGIDFGSILDTYLQSQE